MGTETVGTYDARVKYLVLVPDGCADEPIEELGGRTPLAAASMPNLARLAARGEVGRAAASIGARPVWNSAGS